MRRELASLALGLALLSPTGSEAGLLDGLFGGLFGGGAVHDEGLELREAALIGQKDEDLTLQADRLSGEADALQVEREQLAALDRILASVRAGPDSGTPLAVEE